MTNKNVIGKCPVCGGNVMETALGYCCDGTTKEGRRCFQARFAIEHGKVEVELESHYLKGRCPICGGRVKKTSRGFACENHVGHKASCSFYILGIICNRKITDEEVEAFLAGKALTLDGFSSNDAFVFFHAPAEQAR